MPDNNLASLESVIEIFDLGMEVFHPGGLDSTRELAEICHVGNNTQVLDVASGTGEPLCFLVETFHCRGIGVDASQVMVERAKRKAEDRHRDTSRKKTVDCQSRKRPRPTLKTAWDHRESAATRATNVPDSPQSSSIRARRLIDQR